MRRAFVARATRMSVVALLMAVPACSDDELAPRRNVRDADGSDAGTVASFACSDPSARAPARSYTLTKKQLRNTIQDLFGSAVVDGVAADFGTLAEDTFDKVTSERTSGITSAKVDALFSLAKEIATVVVGDETARTTVFGACSTDAAPAPTCIDTYLNGTAKRIHRRPLTADESGYAKQLAARAGKYTDNLTSILTLHLMSPPFLWRLELGTGQGTPNPVKLSAYEVASRIAFETADTAPDTELLAAADANELSTKVQVQAHVRRLLQTDHGKEKLRNNVIRWSLQGNINSIDSLPKFLTDGIQMSGLGQAMLDETNAYIDHEIFEEKASLETLLTSKASFASHPGLAAIYGHAPATPNAPASFVGRRQGLLMRAPFLTGSDPRTPLIHRGVNFEKLILCNKIPVPGTDVLNTRSLNSFSADEMPFHTTREAVTHQTEAPLCMSCHRTINPVGFAFEAFDPLGRIRSQESIFDSNGTLLRELPIDTTTEIPLPGNKTQPVQDAYDLVSMIASSPEASACFVRNVQRFIFERLETQEDGCALAEVHRIVSDPARPLVDAMVEVIGNDAIFDKQN